MDTVLAAYLPQDRRLALAAHHDLELIQVGISRGDGPIGMSAPEQNGGES